MYFLDETDEWPEYQTIKDEIHRLEQEYLELCKALEEAEMEDISDSVEKDSRSEVDKIKSDLKSIETKLDQSLNMYR
jgi:hypothetical protein